LKKPSLLISKEEKVQKLLFYQLFNFALKICIRYCNLNYNPEDLLYEGFIRLFQKWQHIKTFSQNQLKQELKTILIITYIEREKNFKDYKKDPTTFLSFDKPKRIDPSESLSEIKIINVLRSLPFPLRMIYNMSVIDRFNENAISLLLHIPVNSVKHNLNLARKQLMDLLNLNAKVEMENYIS
jgi:DNA-directed RNA polymerase specialized sigma24 family protein